MLMRNPSSPASCLLTASSRRQDRQSSYFDLQAHQESLGEQKLTLNTKLKVCQACALGTPIYGSETWTTHDVNLGS